jgi:hypothetical protein
LIESFVETFSSSTPKVLLTFIDEHNEKKAHFWTPPRAKRPGRKRRGSRSGVRDESFDAREVLGWARPKMAKKPACPEARCRLGEKAEVRRCF